MKKYLKLIIFLVSLVFVSSVYAEDFIIRKHKTPDYQAFIDRHLEPATKTQIFRIIADGGTIVDYHYMNNVIKKLKAQGVYSSCKGLYDANFAYKNGVTGVTTLYDISGNNNDLLQTVAAAQPIWTANQQNGKATLVFDGNKYMKTAAFTAVAQPNTFFAAMKVDAWGQYYFFDGLTEGTETWLSSWTDNKFYMSAGTSRSVAFTSTSPVLYSVLFNGINSLAYQNGVVLLAAGDAGAKQPTGITLGASQNASYKMVGWWGGLFFINTSLTDAQRVAIQDLINTYYAIY